IGVFLPSVLRHSPIPLKFSSANPSGSIRRWQLAHTALARCSSIDSRSDRILPSVPRSLSAGAFGGGAGGGEAKIFVNNHTPRKTTEVRVGYEVNDRMLPCPSKPRRFSSVRVTRRKLLP